MICNKSSSDGMLPASQKVAVNTPILKKVGLDQDIAANYWPVSNLSYLSWLIEFIVVGQLATYLNNSNLLPSAQSAYRTQHCAETTLLRITFNIFEAVDSSDITLLAHLDLSATFNCIDHAILLTQLRETYGIDGLALSWIASF